MKKRKLKAFVLPTLYLLITISVLTGIIFLGSDYELATKEYNYSTNILNKRNIKPVVSEDNTTSNIIESPIEEDTAEISVYYYSKSDDETRQQNSLIYYENTYLPNTGVLYTSDNSFLVKTVFGGNVVEILEDEFFGKCIVILHDNNIKTYYYGLEDIEVSVGDELTTGAVIGSSKKNEIMNNKYSFLLEVYYNNELINPESFIGSKITDYD